jgi:hypothetical protein
MADKDHNVVVFPGQHNKFPGNGAREAMIAHILECPNVSQADAEAWADFTLADLWVRGFKVVPVDTP